MKKMDSPLDAYKNGGGTPYKMKGHTLPGIKQNKEAKTMLAASAPFQQKRIHGKLTKKIQHKRPQAHGELRKFIDTGAKKGTKETTQHIARSGSPGIGKRMKDTFKEAYKKLKSMKLGGGKLAR